MCVRVRVRVRACICVCMSGMVCTCACASACACVHMRVYESRSHGVRQRRVVCAVDSECLVVRPSDLHLSAFAANMSACKTARGVEKTEPASAGSLCFGLACIRMVSRMFESCHSCLLKYTIQAKPK